MDTQTVILYDRLHSCTTQVFGGAYDTKPFEDGRIRKVLVQDKLNTCIRMGRKNHDPLEFELKWREGPIPTAQRIKGYNKDNATQYGRTGDSCTAQSADITRYSHTSAYEICESWISTWLWTVWNRTQSHRRGLWEAHGRQVTGTTSEGIRSQLLEENNSA